MKFTEPSPREQHAPSTDYSQAKVDLLQLMMASLLPERTQTWLCLYPV